MYGGLPDDIPDIGQYLRSNGVGRGRAGRSSSRSVANVSRVEASEPVSAGSADDGTIPDDDCMYVFLFCMGRL